MKSKEMSKAMIISVFDVNLDLNPNLFVVHVLIFFLWSDAEQSIWFSVEETQI